VILSPDELVTLTARRQKRAQAAVLDALGVPYRLRPDGSVVVFRRDLEQPTPRVQSRGPQLRFGTR
jgi:hypothetical protein